MHDGMNPAIPVRHAIPPHIAHLIFFRYRSDAQIRTIFHNIPILNLIRIRRGTIRCMFHMEHFHSAQDRSPNRKKSPFCSTWNTSGSPPCRMRPDPKTNLRFGTRSRRISHISSSFGIDPMRRSARSSITSPSSISYASGGAPSAACSTWNIFTRRKTAARTGRYRRFVPHGTYRAARRAECGQTRSANVRSRAPSPIPSGA